MSNGILTDCLESFHKVNGMILLVIVFNFLFLSSCSANVSFILEMKKHLFKVCEQSHKLQPEFLK